VLAPEDPQSDASPVAAEASGATATAASATTSVEKAFGSTRRLSASGTAFMRVMVLQERTMDSNHDLLHAAVQLGIEAVNLDQLRKR
jgi:hypothetical protein